MSIPIADSSGLKLPENEPDEKVVEDIRRGTANDRIVADAFTAEGYPASAGSGYIFPTAQERRKFGREQDDVLVQLPRGQIVVAVTERGVWSGWTFTDNPKTFPFDPVHLSLWHSWVEKVRRPDVVVLLSTTGGKLAVNARTAVITKDVCPSRYGSDRAFAATSRDWLRTWDALLKWCGRNDE